MNGKGKFAMESHENHGKSHMMCHFFYIYIDIDDSIRSHGIRTSNSITKICVGRIHVAHTVY